MRSIMTENADATFPSLSSVESQVLLEVYGFVSSLSSNKDHHEIIDDFRILDVKPMKSAQQHVLLLTVRLKLNLCQLGNFDDSDRKLALLHNAVQQSDGMLILRIWQNGARWWNLNLKTFFHLQSDIVTPREDVLCHDLAKAEVAGYEVAKRAFEYYNKHSAYIISPHGEHSGQSLKTDVCVPNVIHFQRNRGDELQEINSSHQRHPWALLSYVGHNIGSGHRNHHDLNDQWVPCEDFIENMVKVRHEFGFDEPHPRHGRVNTNQALEYALHVMHTIIFPLHSAFFDCYFSMSESEIVAGDGNVVSSTVELQHPLLVHNDCDLKLTDYFDCPQNTNAVSWKKACRYSDMVNIYTAALTHLKGHMTYITASDDRNDETETNDKLTGLIRALDKCVVLLQLESKQLDSDDLNTLPAVLCHLDLQPQNMIFRRNKLSHNADEIPKIFSVLDWEESCYADPRFEILLLCRKVVATRSQADVLWWKYEETMTERFGDCFKDKNGEKKNSIIGAIEPWLKLEAVHSLITLSMQGMNVGGRSPWEGSNELWMKIIRELKRLINLGWDFCNDVLDS